ncbi:hypothetical protein [Embleya sp. NPDC050493]|uniref:hypothetical protein n=1 Tax=Embleya sp. NPDC050493 TaxID=3363989 RepID=UPI0037AF808D
MANKPRQPTARPSTLRCGFCDTTEEVTLQADPYSAEIDGNYRAVEADGDHTEIPLCGPCAITRAEEV